MSGIEGIGGAAFGRHLEGARDMMARNGISPDIAGKIPHAENGATPPAARADGIRGGRGPEAFAGLVGDFVRQVDSKGKAAEAERLKLLSGSGTSIHQTMIAMQESSVAFTMMIEVRNKLVEAYQELMRMQV